MLLELAAPTRAASLCAVAWPNIISTCPRTSGSNSASAFMSVILLSKRTISLVTGSSIAVRLEGIAEPGGISISDDARRQIRGKVDITFEDLGSQSLKNIAEPMRVWRVPNGRAVPAVPNRLPVDGALALPDMSHRKKPSA